MTPILRLVPLFFIGILFQGCGRSGADSEMSSLAISEWNEMAESSLALGKYPDEREIETKSGWLAVFQKMSGACIRKKATTEAIFSGCLDWHSAVHGFWSQFRVARVIGTSSETLEVDKLLDVKLLPEVKKFLSGPNQYEMPYGRAWFLRLAVEFKLWSVENRRPDPDRLQSFADEIAQGLTQYLETASEFVSDGAYMNSSWALSQLYVYQYYRRDLASLAKIRGLIIKHLSTFQNATSLNDEIKETNYFFSPLTQFFYCQSFAQSSVAMARLFEKYRLNPSQITPLLHNFSPRSSHSLAIDWSRAWALKRLSRIALSARQKASLFEAYRRHAIQELQAHKKYANDYYSYGHWIPQFAIYALTE